MKTQKSEKQSPGLPPGSPYSRAGSWLRGRTRAEASGPGSLGLGRRRASADRPSLRLRALSLFLFTFPGRESAGTGQGGTRATGGELCPAPPRTLLGSRTSSRAARSARDLGPRGLPSGARPQLSGAATRVVPAQGAHDTRRRPLGPGLARTGGRARG